ncbi:FG-GAP repeat domain-containing protein [Stieleria varia]|uniref:FG-GAP repeat protein n=1 Tax=Stieleria varia TaxID=2528005 RepID=A0A5C6B8P7_9BACT|nr:FG-GAP-like repeat-containing protein [Stieleria varia]TWU07669.1 FG-GAP repeat protein [Stieleria varia]
MKFPLFNKPWFTGVAIGLFSVAMFSVGCGRSTNDRDLPSSIAGTESSTNNSDAQNAAFLTSVQTDVERFCSDCHMMPRPGSAARDEWPDEVAQGFRLYQESGRTDLTPPEQEIVLKYFQLQAPEKLEIDPAIDDYPTCSLKFRQTVVNFSSADSAITRPAAVTNVRWLDLGFGGGRALVYCDVGSGAVKAYWPSPAAKDSGEPAATNTSTRIATLLQPVHVETCDLDSDGVQELVVADIGEFNANDSDLGQVIWLRRAADSDRFEKTVLLQNISRVADVQPGDFDGDGDQDLLVGIFGWRRTGRIVLLRNRLNELTGNEPTTGDLHPGFELSLIDKRHGAVHVPTIDLNGDGHLDFVALISQDQEAVEGFINDGTGKFSRQIIYQAPDPAYGSSGIELVDLDQDGDTDVLFTNGDSFDRGPKPHHSVQWLENKGEYPYTHHHLLNMPGVLNAKAADFDGDGDLDIAACSLLSDSIGDSIAGRNTSSIVLLVQNEPGKFVPTQLEARDHHHISLEIGDFDSNGKVDLAVGTFHRSRAGQPDLKIWFNEN